MEEHKMKELMIDYLEGNLSGELKSFVADHIEKDERWEKDFEELKEVMEAMENTTDLEPNSSLKVDFEAMLRIEMSEEKLNYSNEKQNELTKSIYWNSPKMWMQIAASVTILAVGIVLGINFTNNKAELLALQEEMENTKQLVISSLQNQSASSRLNAVNVSYQMNSMDDEIVDALINTMNTDENANVRLAALEALSQFADEEKVRKVLIASLTTQDKPIVQIALINLMVQLKESRAIEPLKNILNSDEAIEVVKDEANYGVFKLS